jgi:preprotein translocase subunit SecB
MNQDKQPGILCNGIILKSCRFDRLPIVDEETVISPNFEYNAGISEDRKQAACTLTANIKILDKTEKKEFASIFIEYIGIFNVIPSEENMDITSFTENNAAAIIFPYIRQKIHDISISASLAPIILPPINIIAAFKHNL